MPPKKKKPAAKKPAANKTPQKRPPEEQGPTPLFLACQKGDVDAARLLLDKSAEVDRADECGWTPLYIACWKGHVDVARLLLDNGADVNHATAAGMTPLWAACWNGHVDAARLLLEKGAEVDRADNYGQTPLWIACFSGHVDAGRLLLDNGAEVDRATKKGTTPLWIACQNGHVDAARLLFDNGADVNRADKYGATLLYIAKTMGRSSIVALLEDHISKAKEPSGEDDDDAMTSPQVRALKSENASLKAELARVKNQESITRLELLLDRTDAWKRHKHSKGVIAFGFGLGALRGRATTLTDATLDPRMKPILDVVLDVGRRGIAKAEWRYVQTIYLMKNNRRGVHTDARNIGLSHIISFGDYSDAEDPTAGRLSTNNGILNTYRQMCSFYAQDHHAVLRYDDKGTRYTVAYFRTLRDYSEDLREKLNSHGFGLLPAVKRQEICHICEEDTKDPRDRILLCDGSHGQCTAEVHLKCLEPGRSPDDAWFCKFCREASPTSDDPVDNCRVDMTETAGKRIQESLDATPDKRKKRFKRDPG